VCRRESGEVQGSWISRLRKGKEAIGKGICQNQILTLCCKGVLVIGEHSAGSVFLQGLEGTGMCVVALAQRV